jgi:hypothetical protein
LESSKRKVVFLPKYDRHTNAKDVEQTELTLANLPDELESTFAENSPLLRDIG